MKKLIFRIATCVVIGLFGMMTNANATPFSLTNGAGFADGDTAGDLLSDFGAGGVDNLFEENFYIDDSTGVGPVKLTSLPFAVESITPTNVNVRYDGPGYRAHLSLELTAPNMLGESLVIEPLTILQNFRIWEYTDYDVAGTVLGDTATLLGPGHIRQTDGLDYAEVIVHEPTPTHWEIGGFPGLLFAIEAGSDLFDVNNGTPGGDNSFAFEWIIPFLAPGEVFTIDKWKKTGEVPEPGTLGLMALAGCALAAVRMRKRLG